jgi:hypothetical protein
MKWLILLFLISCGDYNDSISDGILMPIGSESILIQLPIHDAENVLMKAGLLIYTTPQGSKTNVFKIKDTGFIQYKLEAVGEYTIIKVMFNDNSATDLYPLKYGVNSSRRAFNYVIDLFKGYNIYYQQR